MAFNDATCPQCGRKISWIGKLVDRPACSRCKHQILKAELEAEDLRLDEMEAKIMERMFADDPLEDPIIPGANLDSKELDIDSI